MTARPVVLIGGGEHARVVAEAASSSGRLQVLGFVDPQPRPETERALGLLQVVEDEATVVARAASEGVGLLLGVGEVGVGNRRRGIVGLHEAHEPEWPPVIHATAWVSPSAQLGRGVVVMAGAMVNACAKLGDFAVVNTGAVVEHDVEVGAFAQIGPGAVVGGGVQIAADAYLGLGSRVRDHLRIGARALVGMAAAVVADVTDDQTVVGVPAALLVQSRR